LLRDIRPALARRLRDAGPRDKDQAQDERPDAPQELPNRRQVAAHRRRDIWPKRQDNDLIEIESAQAAASFKRNFDARYIRMPMAKEKMIAA
jgi:hypothetical protein